MPLPITTRNQPRVYTYYGPGVKEFENTQEAIYK